MHCYIHVPFCARRCSYCDFSIAVRRDTPSREFVNFIRAEWGMRRGAWQSGEALDTLYFGGGTPSRLAPGAIAELIEMFRMEVGLARDIEITVEANPDDITEALAHDWARAGVNRISLGVQSHQQGVLEWMHRTHRADQVAPAVRILKEAGLANLSLDLIFALPAALGRDWSRDLAMTFALEPSHISLYGLTVESRTPLARWTERGESTPSTDDRYAAEYLEAHAALVAHGFEHYEVSNAGLPGRHSRHNAMYWSARDYLGLGPSAHSLHRGARSWNIGAWTAWRDALDAGHLPLEGEERLDDRARLLERRYLGLRTWNGLPAAEIPSDTRRDWAAAGWARETDGRLRLTVEGWLRMDTLVASLRDS